MLEAVVAQGHTMAVGSTPTRRNELLFMNILFSSPWYLDKSVAWSFTTQHAIPRKFGKK